MSKLLAQGQERFRSPIKNYSDPQSVGTLEYQTGQNVNGQKRAADTVVYGVFQLSTANIIEAGSSSRVIIKTAHGARKNDVIHFTSGLCVDVAIQVLSTPDANTMILAATPEFTLAIGDTFDINRYINPKYAQDGSLSVSVPVGGATSANQAIEIAALGQNITTPTAMPAGGVGILGWLSAIWTKLNGSIAVTGTVTATPPAQLGSFAEDLAVTTTPATFTPPAGAFGCFIETDQVNTTNIRVKMGATAGVASGIQFQPGRSEYYQGGSNISYCTESGAGKVSVQWFTR